MLHGRHRSYDRRMEAGAGVGPVPVAWWRLLGLGAMMIALYFVIRNVTASQQTHPALLVPAVLLGGAIGAVAGRRGVAALMSPRQTGHRGRRRRRAGSKSSAPAYFSGLAGLGLILAQGLSAGAMEWVMIGGTALMSGGAGHAWVMARHYGRVESSLTD